MAGFQNSSANKLYANPSNSPLPATTAQSATVPTANTSAGPYAAPSSSQQHPATPTSPAPSNNSSPTQTSNSSPNGQHHAGPARATPTLHSNSAFSPYHNSIPAAHPTPVTTPTSSKPQLSQPHPPQEQNQPSTMMTTTSHIETTSANALIYPPHTTHFASTPFWSQQWGPLSNGTSAGTVALQGPGASAFMPATVGYGTTPSIQHTPRPKLTTTIWEDEGTLCYQVDARGICVARRQDNDMINGTKLLNVVGMSRGKRDGILKNEKGRVVVKVGAMHLKGVWITFQRAKTLAAQFKISDLLYPVFVDDPSIFLHNSYGAPITSTRIPSMGSQWRPHPFGAISNTAYTDAGRSWYPYSNGAMVPASAAPTQEHGAPAYQHATTNGTHDDEYGGYAVVGGQTQSQAGVVFQRPSYDVGNNTPATITANSTPRTGTPVYANVKTEETAAAPNGTSYYNRPGPGQLYSLVSAAEAMGNGSTPQSGSPQLIGQKRSYDDSESDEYNNGSTHSSPPLAMHPPPLNSMAVNTMNVTAAGSFPSPLNASPNSSPGSSAFSNWPHHKRMKYEYPEATTPSSQQSSPRISGNYQQLPALANCNQGSNAALATSTQTYANGSLQMVTNAQQGSPHHCSSVAAANGPATGTTTPTTEGLGYFQDAAGGDARRYEQYRPRDDAGEALAGGAWD